MYLFPSCIGRLPCPILISRRFSTTLSNATFSLRSVYLSFPHAFSLRLMPFHLMPPCLNIVLYTTRPGLILQVCTKGFILCYSLAHSTVIYYIQVLHTCTSST
ncbi:hypothetical protein BDV98DRAFT_422399 [Pterulicium gracile]|uniref:Uncharacterized protein n=1 Tax=Pterulicium gracile TaxID=1884261 RepID=A0A5C3Q072_9AGAR|nr:hypothetical protein BDV98DRAFT_422399 [Pterula gracilis]